MLFFISCYQVKLTFCDEALQSIAKQALSRGTGARGLRSIMVRDACKIHVHVGDDHFKAVMNYV